jgi:hypothetical protein
VRLACLLTSTNIRPSPLTLNDRRDIALKGSAGRLQCNEVALVNMAAAS